MVRLSLGMLLVGCYGPQLASGSPCDPGPCPAELICSAAHMCEPTAPDTTPWLAGYAHRKRITVTPTASMITLVDFPVSILESSDADLASDARSDGADIVFTDASGTTLVASELVSYDSGTFDAWVRMTLPPATPTIAFMYYGGPATTASAAATWSQQFAGVWHMAGTAAIAPDSTIHHHDAMAGTTSQQPGEMVGIAGLSRVYDGVDDSLAVADATNGGLDFGTGSFTYSVWVFVVQSVGPYDIVLHKGDSSIPEPGYDLELGTGQWDAGVSDSVTYHFAIFGQESEFLGRWVQLAAVVDRSAAQLRTYADGAPTGTANLTGFGAPDDKTRVLSLGLASQPFHGQLDEVRLVSAALPEDWIASEHENLVDRARFVSLEPAESQ